MTTPSITRRQLLMLGCTAAISQAFRPHGNIFAESVTMRESRAVLDEGLHWVGRNGAETVCRRIKSAGFNVFIPCVWQWKRDYVAVKSSTLGQQACFPARL